MLENTLPGHDRKFFGSSRQVGESADEVRLDAFAALVEQMADGDQAATAELHAAFHSPLLRVAQAMLRHPADAEEVVSDTFAKAWRDSASFDASRATVGGWLMMMLRSRARDVIRSRIRRDRAHDRAEALAAIDSAAINIGGSVQMGVAEVLESDELSAMLAHALRRLPDRQREAIELVFLRSVPHSHAATELGVPLGTIKTRVRSGLRQMRATLQQSGLTFLAIQ